MSPHDFVRILRRYWLLTLIFLLFGVGSGIAGSLLVTPLYTSASRVFVYVDSPSASVLDLSQGGAFAEKMVDSYAEVATSPKVLVPVIDRLRLDTTTEALAKRMSVETTSSSVVMGISVSDPKPKRAAAIANAVTDELASVVSTLNAGSKDGAAVKISTIAPAEPTLSPSSPNVPINVLVGVIAGLLLAAAVIGIRRLVLNKVETVDDVAEVSDVPLVGEIARERALAQQPLRVLHEPLGGYAESVRDLRTNLQYLATVEGNQGSQTIVITSGGEGEGKTSTTVNLGLALAAAQSVVVVDADLRKPRVAEVFGLDGSVGLTDVLVGRATLDDALQTVGGSGLVVLPAGGHPPNASELLQSAAMKDLIMELAARFSTVVFDTPPAGVLSDARVLARECSGALIVVAVGRSRRPQIRAAIAGLRLSGAKPLGLVATFVPSKSSGYYYEDALPSRAAKAVEPRRPVTGEREKQLTSGRG